MDVELMEISMKGDLKNNRVRIHFPGMEICRGSFSIISCSFVGEKWSLRTFRQWVCGRLCSDGGEYCASNIV